ncbi:MAG: YceI family protein [Leptospiraceae bacterium]|nr:YceI family protein [Leptospiraceae bacterium]
MNTVKKLPGLLAALLALTLTVPALAEPSSGLELDRRSSAIQFFVDAKLVDVEASFRAFKVDGLQFDGKNPESLKGSIVIWPASVFTRDKKRDEHLRQDDFFWVEKYPTSTVKLLSVSKTDVSGVYDFHIELHIRDKTKEYTVPTKVLLQDGGLSLQGAWQVDRRDFDLNGEHVANLVMNNMVDLKYTINLKKIQANAEAKTE